MRNIFLNRKSSKLGLLGSLVAVVAVAFVLVLVPQKTNIKTLAENCVNPPTTPTLNYWPITYDDVNTPLCHDFPAIDAAVYTGGSPAYSKSEADWNNGLTLTNGQEGVALMYIHNGAANNLPAAQTTARDVKITTTTDTTVGGTHNIAVKFAGSNTNTVNKSFAVHTPTDSRLEIVPNSGFMYDYQGHLILDQQHLNLGNSTYTLGNLDACFEYSLFLTFRFKVVTPPNPVNPTLSITKQVRSIDKNGTFASSATVDQNERVGYKVVVTNNGPTTANNVTMTDNSVAGVAVDAGSTTVGTADDVLLPNNLWQGAVPGTINLGNLAPGEHRIIKYTGKVTASTGTLTNTATAVASNAPSVSATASVTVRTIIVTNPNLNITKLVKNNTTNTGYESSATTRTGDRVNFKVTITNTGNADLPDAKIVDPIPAGLQFDDSVSTTGTPSFSGTTLTVNFGTLPAGQSRSVEFAAKVTQTTAGQICNIATASGRGVNPVNATACITNIVQPNDTRILAITKLVKNNNQNTTYSSSTTAKTGEWVNFKVTLTNNGNATINNAKVTDPIPAGLQFDNNSVVPTGVASFSGTTLTVNFGSLTAGQTRTVEFAAQAVQTTGGQICNVATGTGDSASSVNATACVTIATPGNPTIVLSKSAFNNTKNVDATTVTADRGNTITFTIKTTNTGTADAVNYVISDDLSGVLPLADIVDNAGSTLNGNILSYPAMTIRAGETVTKTFKVAVKSTLAPNLSYQIRNTYGNTVLINIPGNVVYVAPKTGSAGTSAAVFAGLITIAAVAVRRGKDIMGFIFA